MTGRIDFILTLVVATAVNRLVQGQLTQVSSCICPDDTVVYTCSVSGTGFTIWNGSAFNCPRFGSEIFLSHSLFGGDGVSGSCNEGALIGRSIGVSDSTYTSQLAVNLTANSSVIGERIDCVYRSSDNIDTTIGSSLVQLADPLPPPSGIQLVKVSQDRFTFSWRPVESNCTSVQYGLQSDCGECINNATTAKTSIICVFEQSMMAESHCFFAVQTIICGSVPGILSDRINLTLKVPEPPPASNIYVLSYYNASNQKLLVLDIKFDELDEYFISDGIGPGVSVLSYTINYTNPANNSLCDSLTINPNQSCFRGECTVPSFNPVPCSRTMEDGVIDIAISARNILGNGPASIVHADFVNKVVNITFESDTRILCIFLQQSSSKSMTCSIDYGECGLELNIMHREGQELSNSSDMVIIELSLANITRVYCYTINASKDGNRVFIRGTRVIGGPRDSPEAIAIGISLALALMIALVIIVSLIAYAICLYRRISKGARLAARGYSLIEQLSPKEVLAHIKFDAEDKPHELVKALEKLGDGHINIANIRIGPCSDLSDHKTIYIKCVNNLKPDEKDTIEKDFRKLGFGKELIVSCKATKYNVTVDDDEDYNSSHMKIEVKVCLKHESGALVELLKFINSLDNWQQINLTDIGVFLANSPNQEVFECRNVILKFQSNVDKGWKKKFDKEKGKCSAIVQRKQSEQCDPGSEQTDSEQCVSSM